MDWLNWIGSISGIVALLTIAFFFGIYISKINAMAKVQEQCPINTISVKIDDLWNMKDDLHAAIIKADALWKVYIEENSNPGGGNMLPENLRGEITALLDNDDYLLKVKEPTLLVVEKLGLHRFVAVAKVNKQKLGQILAEVNTLVFEHLQR